MKKTKKTPAKAKSAPRAPKSDVIKLQGNAIWIFIGGNDDGVSRRFEIHHAILRDGGKELAIDCDRAQRGDPSYVYTIVLHRVSPLLFRGEWSAGRPADRTGTCSCRVYSNGPRLALVGTWQQDNGTQQWLVELSPAA